MAMRRARRGAGAPTRETTIGRLGGGLALALCMLLLLALSVDAQGQSAPTPPPAVAEPPRRSPAIVAPSPAPDADTLPAVPVQPRDALGARRWGVAGWFGAAAVAAGLALMAAGVAGAFRPPRAPARSGRAAADAAVPETEAAEGVAAAVPRAPAPPMDPVDPADAIGVLALHDELSPRRRRAAAYAYGARDLPSPARRRPAERQTIEAAAEPCAQAAPEPGVAASAADAAALAEGQDDLARRSADLVDRIRRFSKTEAGLRRNRR